MRAFTKFFIICSLLNFSAQVHGAEIVDWSLPETQQADEEFLLYRLSFSGLLTAFSWKDLADTAIIADNKAHTFHRKKSCQLRLKVSTENFLISELFAPTRYLWRTTVTPDISQVLMFEEINKNQDDVHQVTWLNKNKNRLEVFHKRKKFPVEDEELADDEYDNGVIETKWELSGKKNPPSFLLNEPKLEGGLDYLVYEKAIKITGSKPVFDPLALIYSARWYDYHHGEKANFIISYKNVFRQYQVAMEAKEVLQIGDANIDTLRIAIKRQKNEREEGEAYMLMWLSDDERRIPLQYLIEIKPGTMMLKINAENLKNYQPPVNCIESAEKRALIKNLKSLSFVNRNDTDRK